jgi:LemA protein
MKLSRMMEFCLAVLLAFLVLTFVSFLTLRPALNETRKEARADWENFVAGVALRNQALPGLAEGVRSFEQGHSRLLEKLLETRALLMKPQEVNPTVTLVDDMDRYLAQLAGIARARPRLAQHPPFAVNWKRVVEASQRIQASRDAYNRSAELYNRLLRSFPQNLLASALGFVPLTTYPVRVPVSDLDG